MAVEVIFPRVDMDMTSGRINRWLAEEGSTVRKGDPLFEIETDKAAMEIEAPAAGTLHTLRPADGAEIAVGSPVAWIVPAGEAWQPAAEPAPDPQPAAQAEIRATPLARREAARLGLDLTSVAGSGPRGRVLSADLEGLLARPARPAVAPEVTAASLPVAPMIGVAAEFASAVAEPASAVVEPAPVGARLYRTWVGQPVGTPLVFLHGFAADQYGWRPVWSVLQASQRMLAIDLPGHGRSPPVGDASFAGLVASVRAALDEEGVGRAHLVGHSLGGAVALALAEQADLDVRSVTLLAPAGLGPDIDAGVLSGLIRAERAESLAPWLRRLFADSGFVTPAYAQAVLRARAVPGLRDFQSALAELIFPDGTQSIDVRYILPRLAVPVRIVWGEADAIIPVRQSRKLPGEVALHVLPGVGHMPHVEAKDLVAALVQQSQRAGE